MLDRRFLDGAKSKIGSTRGLQNRAETIKREKRDLLVKGAKQAMTSGYEKWERAFSGVKCEVLEMGSATFRNLPRVSKFSILEKK